MKKKQENTDLHKEKTKHFKLLASFLRGSVVYFTIGIIASLIVTGLDVLIPQLVRFTVNSVIEGEPTDLPFYADAAVKLLGGADVLRQRLYIIAIAIAVIAVLAALSRYLQRIFNAKASETLVERMRNMLFAHIQRLPFSWHMKNQTGDIIQRCTSDVETVKNFLSDQLVSILRIVIQVAFSLFTMFSMNVNLALAATLSLSLVFLYSLFFGRKIGKHFKDCDEAEGKLSAIAQENLTGVRVVRAFGREKYEGERFKAQNKEHRDLNLHLSRLIDTFWGVGDFIIGLQVMTVIVLGVFASRDSGLSAGDFIAFVSYNAMLTWPVRRLGRMISEMSKASISIDRLGYILSSETEPDPYVGLTPDMHGDIVFDDVSFAYDSCPELISHVSFTAKSGTTVGILGGTGSGKSTLMHLLGRLYELPLDKSGGRITISGVDIADISTSHLRSNIGIVLQEPYLFSRTLSDNIGIAKDGITLDEIKKASSVACLDKTVENFTDGYDTFVGERGVTLSGGQKQRTAIARMLTQKAPVMIFDDSLSAVDAETDAKIREALSDKLHGSTVFMISHRTSTLMNSDLIIVLDHGKIAECGTHDELIAIENGTYRKVFELQSSVLDTEAGKECIGNE